MSGTGREKGRTWKELSSIKDRARFAMVGALGLERAQKHIDAVAAGWRAPLSVIPMPPDWVAVKVETGKARQCYVCGCKVTAGYRKRSHSGVGEKRFACYPCSDVLRRQPENIDATHLMREMARMLRGGDRVA